MYVVMPTVDQPFHNGYFFRSGNFGGPAFLNSSLVLSSNSGKSTTLSHLIKALINPNAKNF
jgi:hypothetical protein